MKLCLATLLLILIPNLGQAQSSVIQVGVTSAKVPKNPRSDQESKVIVGGFLRSSCYRLRGVRVEPVSPGQHRIVVEADITSQDCKKSKTPFQESVNLGMLKPGSHFITFTREDGTDRSVPFKVKAGRPLRVEDPNTLNSIFSEQARDSALPTETYQAPHKVETTEGEKTRIYVPPAALESAPPPATDSPPETPAIPSSPEVPDEAVPFNADDLPGGT